MPDKFSAAKGPPDAPKVVPGVILRVIGGLQGCLVALSQRQSVEVPSAAVELIKRDLPSNEIGSQVQ